MKEVVTVRDGEVVEFEDSLGESASPRCTCLESVNSALRDRHGAELGAFFTRGGGRLPAIYVRRLAFGAQPPFVLPSFCPFCGTRYGRPSEALPLDVRLAEIERRLDALEQKA